MAPNVRNITVEDADGDDVNGMNLNFGRLTGAGGML